MIISMKACLVSFSITTIRKEFFLFLLWTRRHIKRIHQNNYAFRCGVCGKGFNEKRDFKLHVDTHSGVKNYKVASQKRLYI